MSILDKKQRVTSVTGILAPDLLVLGQWGSDKALVVVEAGGKLQNGGFQVRISSDVSRCMACVDGVFGGGTGPAATFKSGFLCLLLAILAIVRILRTVDSR